jgi:hypothetical protein
MTPSFQLLLAKVSKLVPSVEQAVTTAGSQGTRRRWHVISRVVEPDFSAGPPVGFGPFESDRWSADVARASFAVMLMSAYHSPTAALGEQQR